MNAVEAIGQAGFAAAIFGGFACWFICVINMFRAVQYRKPGVALFPSWYESPFNILFYPSQLTDRPWTGGSPLVFLWLVRSH
jgi:hypothetical protein